jgi:hypothetical protein
MIAQSQDPLGHTSNNGAFAGNFVLTNPGIYVTHADTMAIQQSLPLKDGQNFGEAG